MIPPCLQKGDTILIIATARAKNKEFIDPAIKTLEGWGLIVELGANIFKSYHQFAGTDKERADDLQWAINHKTAKSVLISSGGYGTLRIIDRINFKPLLKNPKWFIGYSDTTVIHSRLMNLNIASIHGTMAFQFLKNKKATLSIKNLLFGQTINYIIKKHKLNKEGSATGDIIGGNLSLLYALSGSSDDFSGKNKILFIEDLDEQLYHIDRMMHQLKRSGKLKNLNGLIVGGMSDMKDNAIPYGKTAEEIIYEAVKEYKYPVCFNFPAGHIKNNTAIYFGKKARLEISKEKISLRYI